MLDAGAYYAHNEMELVSSDLTVTGFTTECTHRDISSTLRRQ
jgi:hypothetical protein